MPVDYIIQYPRVATYSRVFCYWFQMVSSLYMRSFHKIFLVVLTVTCLLSCKEDLEKSSVFEVNEWIYREMQEWYLWTDDLSRSPNYAQESGLFYQSLLVSQDRFSFYYEDYQTLINLLNGVSLDPGFEYRLFYDKNNPNNILGSILYVKPDSPASEAGLRRGDLFSKINGVTMNEANHRSLLESMQSTFEMSFTRYDFGNETFGNEKWITLTPVEYAENPFLLDTVYQISEKKIGYLIYNFFATGPTENSTIYTQTMDQIFSGFKAEGISELIVDFRYNSGGSETSVKNLASYIVPPQFIGRNLIKKQYNTALQNYIANEPSLGSDYLNVQFENKASSIGNQLSSGNVYFITSSRTASASEATINALKPFLNLKIIGDTTLGKDVGSRTISDENNKSNRIGLQPIIVKIVNDSNEDYPLGFVPKVTITEGGRMLYPLGNVNEQLLQAAINEIVPLPARRAYTLNSEKTLAESFFYRGLIVE